MNKYILKTYFAIYVILSSILLANVVRHVDFSKIAELIVVGLYIASGLIFTVTLPRARFHVAFFQPVCLFALLMLGGASTLPVTLAFLLTSTPLYRQMLQVIKSTQPKDWLRIALSVFYNATRMVPVLFVSSLIYEKLGGAEFHSWSEARVLPLFAMTFSLVALNELTMNIAAALSEGKPPWVWVLNPIELIDVPFTPLAIPLYLLYQSNGIQAIAFVLLPFSGVLWLFKKFFHDYAERQESIELLNVANELISSTTHLDEMITKVIQKLQVLFKIETVELFMKNSDAWELKAFVGPTPWKNAKPEASFFQELENNFPSASERIADIRGDRRFLAYQNAELFSLLLIPLFSGKKILGFILCAHKIPGFFSGTHLEFSNVLVGQLSTALQSAKLHAELVETLKKLQETQAQLIQSEKMAGLGKLVAGVAHELNNPLNLLSLQIPIIEEKIAELQGLVEAYAAYEPALPKEDQSLLSELREKLHLNELSPFFQKSFWAVREGMNRSKRIVDNLRVFARTETLGESWDFVDLHDALDSTLIILSPLHQDRVTVHKDFSSIPKVWCNAPQINQVLMNILANAFDAIEKNGEVWIGTSTSKGNVEMTIRDNGQGMSEETMKRIFEPFFTTKEVGKGTGLGLSIVYGIIKQHKGEIQVETKENAGTTFRIILPAEPSPTPKQET